MKNKNYIIVFALIIAFLLVMVSSVYATDDNPLNLDIVNETPVNEAQPTNNTDNTELPIQNNTVPITNSEETVNNTQTNSSLPQTGVAEDTALFVFIAVCIVSAIYAFVKIKNYKNI